MFDQMGIPPAKSGAVDSRFQLGAGDSVINALSGTQSYDQLFGGVVPGTGLTPPVRPAVIAKVTATHVDQFDLSKPGECARLSALKMQLTQRQLERTAGVIASTIMFSPEHATFVHYIEWVEVELRKDTVPELATGRDMRHDFPPVQSDQKVIKRPRRTKSAGGRKGP